MRCANFVSVLQDEYDCDAGPLLKRYFNPVEYEQMNIDLLENYTAQAVVDRTQKVIFQKNKELFVSDDMSDLNYLDYRKIVSSALAGLSNVKIQTSLEIANAFLARNIKVYFDIQLLDGKVQRFYTHQERQEFINKNLTTLKSELNSFSIILNKNLMASIEHLEKLKVSDFLDIELDWTNQEIATEWSEKKDFSWILSILRENSKLINTLISSEMDFYETKAIRSAEYYYCKHENLSTSEINLMHPQAFSNFKDEARFVQFILMFLGYQVSSKLMYCAYDEKSDTTYFYDESLSKDERLYIYEEQRLQVQW